MDGSSRRAGGRRYVSTSEARANWGMRVSSLVDTTTVRDREGSTWSQGGQPGQEQQGLSTGGLAGEDWRASLPAWSCLGERQRWSGSCHPPDLASIT